MDSCHWWHETRCGDEAVPFYTYRASHQLRVSRFTLHELCHDFLYLELRTTVNLPENAARRMEYVDHNFCPARLDHAFNCLDLLTVSQPEFARLNKDSVIW